MYRDKDLIDIIFCQKIDQFNEIKITLAKFYSILLKEIHPFYDGTARMYKINLLIMIK